jgi:hypothetical protein
LRQEESGEEFEYCGGGWHKTKKDVELGDGGKRRGSGAEGLVSMVFSTSLTVWEQLCAVFICNVRPQSMIHKDSDAQLLISRNKCMFSVVYKGSSAPFNLFMWCFQAFVKVMMTQSPK